MIAPSYQAVMAGLDPATQRAHVRARERFMKACAVDAV